MIDNIDPIRYKGHLSLHEISADGQARIAAAKVLIVGAGGLGSPVALYLAAAGVGTIGLVDPDKVSLSNLQRQIAHATPDIGRLKVDSVCDKATAINPGVTVERHVEFLSPRSVDRLLSGYDMAVDCVDNMSTRIVLAEACRRAGKPCVHGAVRRFGGQLFTYVPGAVAYPDLFPVTDDAAPEDVLPCSVEGVLNTVVGVIGTLQATEVIKLITGVGRPLASRLLTFDALEMRFEEFALC